MAKKARVTVYVSPKAKEFLRTFSAERSKSMSALLREHIEVFYDLESTRLLMSHYDKLNRKYLAKRRKLRSFYIG